MRDRGMSGNLLRVTSVWRLYLARETESSNFNLEECIGLGDNYPYIRARAGIFWHLEQPMLFLTEAVKTSTKNRCKNKAVS